MGWRDEYKVHPAADVLPMMSDEELAELGEDIKANGLKVPMAYTVIDGEKFILDGRNRLEAMERAGIKAPSGMLQPFTCCADHGTAASTIISVNIKRRHLTKEQKADMIVAVLTAAKDAKAAKLDQVEPVSVGGRGIKNPLKHAAIEEGKKHGIHESTIKRSLAKAEGKKPKLKPKRRASTRFKAFTEGFLTTVESVGVAAETYNSDEALDLLDVEQRAHAIEIIETTIMHLQKAVDRLGDKDRYAA